MKTITSSQHLSSNNVGNKIILSIASVLAIVVVNVAFHAPGARELPKNETQFVVISAPLMSEQEKITYDIEQTGTQHVVISAKRLSAAEKLAALKQDRLL